MSKIRLGIFVSDEAYAQKLAAYIREKEKGRIEPCLITRADPLEKIAALDMALADESEFILETLQNAGIDFVVLVDDVLPGRPYRQVKRYQKASTMLREAVVQTHPENASGQGQTRFMAVCSPVHHDLQMFITMCMAKELSLTQHVLYVNLLAYTGFSRIFGTADEDDLEDVMLWMGRPGFSIKDHVSVIQGVEMILPPRRPEFLWEADTKEFERFFDRVAAAGYDIVLFDIGLAIPAIFSLLEECSAVYVLGREGYLADQVYSEWKHSVIFCLGEEFSTKVTYTCPGMSGLGIAERELLLEELYRGNLGDYARGILEKRNETN